MKRFVQRLDRLGYATGQLFVFLIAAIVLFFTLVLRGQVTFLPVDLVEGSVATLSAASYALLRSRFWSIRGRLLAASFAPVVIFFAQGRGPLFVAVYAVVASLLLASARMLHGRGPRRQRSPRRD
jgi:hypothetical protein